jgi:hypothetical protein
VSFEHAVKESGMDVGIVNAEEMLAVDEVEPALKIICDYLVFNKAPEATDDMLERTEYEPACVDAKKKGLPPPRKPRGKMAQIPKLQFDFDQVAPTPATEPPTRVNM